MVVIAICTNARYGKDYNIEIEFKKPNLFDKKKLACSCHNALDL